MYWASFLLGKHNISSSDIISISSPTDKGKGLNVFSILIMVVDSMVQKCGDDSLRPKVPHVELLDQSRGEYNVNNLKLCPDARMSWAKLFPNLRGAEGAELQFFLDFYPKLPKIPHSTAMKVQKLFPRAQN